MIGRRLRRNCVILGRCEPLPVLSAACNLVYVLTPRVSHSKGKSVGTSRDEKLTKIPFIHPFLAWSLHSYLASTVGRLSGCSLKERRVSKKNR